MPGSTSSTSHPDGGTRRALLQATVTRSIVDSQANGGVLSSALAQQLLSQYAALWGSAFTVFDCGGTPGSSVWQIS